MNAAVILRSVNDASYTVTRLGTVFYSVRHDVLTQVSTGEGLRTFRLNIKVPSSWTVGPEDEGKLDSLQGQMSQMTSSPTPLSEFHHHQLLSRNVGKKTTNRRCVKSQNSADLIYTVFRAWNHATVEVLHFLLSACHENAQGAFFVVLFTCMVVI